MLDLLKNHSDDIQKHQIPRFRQGEDVSPDFYAWVFPKCDHVAVGTGTVVDKKLDQKARVLMCFAGLAVCMLKNSMTVALLFEG